MTEICTRAYR